MNKIIKCFFNLFFCATIIISTLCFSVSAESKSRISLEPNRTSFSVGETIVVKVTYSADEPMHGVEGLLSFNSSVLKYVSGGTNASLDPDNQNNIIMAEAPSTNSYSFSITFEAISIGTSGLSSTMFASCESGDLPELKQGVTLNITAPAAPPASSSAPEVSEPSGNTSNANLAMLRVQGAVLSPAFSQNTTTYTATVANNVTSCKITASVADKSATVNGAGTVELEVGDNVRSIVVTAADGTKKTYTLTIHRQTEEETANSSLPSEPTEGENPLNVTVGVKNLNIVSDISTLYMPDGYSIETEKRGEIDVMRLKENDGERMLYYLNEEGSAEAKLYSYDEKDGFSELDYITANGKMYIIESFKESFAAPDGYYESVLHVSGSDVDAYKFDDPELNDFYIIYCYIDGEYGFYRYDSLETVLQRAPDFKPATAQTADANADDNNKGLLDRFNKLGGRAKAIILLVAGVVIGAIAMVVMLIFKFAEKPAAKPAVFDPSNEPVPFDEDEIYSGFDFESSDDKKEE